MNIDMHFLIMYSWFFWGIAVRITLLYYVN